MSADLLPIHFNGPLRQQMIDAQRERHRRLFNGGAPDPKPTTVRRIALPRVNPHILEALEVNIVRELPSIEEVEAQVDDAIDGQRNRITCRQVIAEVCHQRDVHPRDLMSMSRSRPIVRARQEICWRMRHEVTIQGRQISLPEIGRQLGGLDHTTVLHGIRKHTALLEAGGE